MDSSFPDASPTPVAPLEVRVGHREAFAPPDYEEILAKQLEKEKQRWRAIITYGIQPYMAKHRQSFRRRVQQYGIPAEFRWEVWKAAVRVEAQVRPGLYQELLQMESKWTRLIDIDIARTFPDIPLFDTEQQQSLLRILLAYANMNPEVGYCQGMNFVAGLLMYVCQNEDFGETPRLEKEEETFWVFVCLMEERRLNGFYKHRFPLLRRYSWAFDQLAAETLPKLRDHFRIENVQHAAYLHQWFLTLFINCLPLPMVLVFWDILVCGGFDLILPLTVSLLQVLEKTLLALQFEDLLRFLKNMRISQDPKCNTVVIAREIIVRAARVLIPSHVVERLLEAESLEEDSDWSPAERDRGIAGALDGRFGGAEEEIVGDAHDGSWANLLSSTSFARFGGLGLDLAQDSSSFLQGVFPSMSLASAPRSTEIADETMSTTLLGRAAWLVGGRS